MTNKQIIDALLPYMRKAEAKLKAGDEIQFHDKDYYGNPYYETRDWDGKIGGHVYTRYTKYGDSDDLDDSVTIEVYISLKGKFDHATLVSSPKNRGRQYGYAKEYAGMGNGYYADVSRDGKIIRGEWD